jgi:hypothetical protein
MGDAANKIASIFVEAATDAAFDEIQLSESEKMDKAIKAVKSVLDKAHTGILTRMKAKPLHDVLSNYCREDAILLIHKFVKEYETFINSTTPITGHWVIYTQDPYADKTDDFIKKDIKFTIFIVYFEPITEEGVKMAVTKALKGIVGTVKEIVHKEFRRR